MRNWTQNLGELRWSCPMGPKALPAGIGPTGFDGGVRGARDRRKSGKRWRRSSSWGVKSSVLFLPFPQPSTCQSRSRGDTSACAGLAHVGPAKMGRSGLQSHGHGRARCETRTASSELAARGEAKRQKTFGLVDQLAGFGGKCVEM